MGKKKKSITLKCFTVCLCCVCFSDQFQHWRVKDGGDRLIVECPPVGSDSIPEEAGLPTQHCFVSSYFSCFRSQTITLQGLGIEPWMLDILRPEIKVSEWLVEGNVYLIFLLVFLVTEFLILNKIVSCLLL